MPLFSQLDQANHPSNAFGQSKGFVLLEVLLAMSLILTSWLALAGTYQNLALRAAQEDQKRAELKKQLDEFEIREHQRLNQTMKQPGKKIESSRMSSRSRIVPATTKSPIKK
jgi:Tfp pilus assembly protein PilV